MLDFSIKLLHCTTTCTFTPWVGFKLLIRSLLPSTVLYLRHCVIPRHIKHSRRWINIMKGKMAELPLSVTSGCRWHSVQEQMSVCNLLRKKEKMQLFKMNFSGFHIREWALFVFLSQRQCVPKLPSCCLCVLFSSIEGYHLTNKHRLLLDSKWSNLTNKVCHRDPFQVHLLSIEVFNHTSCTCTMTLSEFC